MQKVKRLVPKNSLLFPNSNTLFRYAAIPIRRIKGVAKAPARLGMTPISMANESFTCENDSLDIYVSPIKAYPMHA
jgi:hypothetical protein